MADGPALRTRKALAHLDGMAEEWAREVDADGMAARIADMDDRETRIVALLKQAFVEGAYKCYCDAKDGKIPWLKPL